MKIIIERIKIQDMPNALEKIAQFLKGWKNVERLEIIMGDVDA
jgi:hypothetical protein